MIDFDKINAAALSAYPGILYSWLPGGKIHGREYVCGSVAGGAGSSMSVNIASGKWADFASDAKGGDPVSLYAAIRSIDQGTAGRELTDIFGLGDGVASAPRARASDTSKTPIIPVPSDAPALRFRHPQWGAPTQVWPYHVSAGLAGYVARFDTENPDGEVGKTYLPLTYCDLGDGRAGWRSKGIPDPRPLYRLSQIAASDGSILVCEGEKSADAAVEIFPGAVSTTPMHGAKSPQKTDWSPVRGRDVVVWPDNDAPGRDFAEAVARMATDAGALSVRIVTVPAEGPNGWDLADPAPGGWNLAAMLMGARLWSGISQCDDFDFGPESGHLCDEPPPHDCVDTPAEFNAIDIIVEQLNQEYMVVNENGDAVIYELAMDYELNRERIRRYTFESFRKILMNRKIKIGTDKNGNDIKKSVADVWLNHQKRLQYIKGTAFDPSGRASVPGVLNLWRGFAVEPVSGDWSILRQHIINVLCNGNDDHFTYLMGWMARLMQFPAQQGEVAVVMKGKEGTGKGTLGKILIKLIGHHSISINNPKHLVGNFNSHLRDAVFLFADEAFFAGDKASIGALKSIITDDHLTIEGKYQNAIQAKNYLHTLMASNESWVVPASLESRRFFVLEVNDSMMKNYPYFIAIDNQMKNRGYEALMYDLLNYDLSEYNVRDVPVTKGLHEQRKMSLDIKHKWWMDCLQKGHIFDSKNGLEDAFNIWTDTVSNKLLFLSYVAFSERNKERHPLQREEIGKFIGSFADQCRIRDAIIGERMTDSEGARRVAEVLRDNGQLRGYRVGTLTDARASFERVTGLQVEWDGLHEPDHEATEYDF